MHKPYLIDLTGHTYGHLKVLAFSHSEPHGKTTNKHRPVWDCICSCGEQKKIKGAYLRNGHSLSCGHVREENFKKWKLPVGEAAFNQVWASYQQGAKSRGYSFELSQKEFKTLVASDCVYCGSKPSNKKKIPSGSMFIYTGIDRRDNKVGYTEENTVPCCKLCNRMKGNLPFLDFVKHLRRFTKIGVTDRLRTLESAFLRFAQAKDITNETTDPEDIPTQEEVYEDDFQAQETEEDIFLEPNEVTNAKL